MATFTASQPPMIHKTSNVPPRARLEGSPAAGGIWVKVRMRFGEEVVTPSEGRG
jgi:hypothetical protein